MTNKHIDFNSDLAQGFGIYTSETEFQMLDYVSSVNISCGFHAGNPTTIRDSILQCKEKNVAVGAHIGFYDLEGFGYTPTELDESELEALVIYQLGAIASFAKTYDITIEHVRPHGAMYKQAAESFDFSLSLAKAIKKFDKWLIYYGASNENLEKVGEETGLVIAREIFADRPYLADGSIDWESKEPISADATLNRVRTIMHSSQMKLSNNSFIPVKCDTIHFAAKSVESVETVKKSKEIINPTPVNFNKVESAGWV